MITYVIRPNKKPYEVMKAIITNVLMKVKRTSPVVNLDPLRMI